MTRVDRLQTVFVDEIPEILEDGILYVSEECCVALHNCACGCGEEVSTPLVRTEYRLTMEGDAASIWPSIGNHDFACASHYVIKQGKILWAGRMSRGAIEAGRKRDRRLKRPPAPKPAPIGTPTPKPRPPSGTGLVQRTLAWIKAICRKLIGRE
ncbi:DUF6527 family protein [Sphingobium sp. YC-XJ3]|uniref:DUF6527 family protein n=1 Tax=Sphingobium sp. YC-XJ3 TaxID=3024245 RepID=UPI002361A0D1|nr:DUF6527 family protein [Sphingobium sp. YC-XJ3]WDA38941.1 DUF6527 family protein [Sphingobium sp. YC-XJ3]